MTNVVDSRQRSRDGDYVNRKRFLDRYKPEIKKAIDKFIAGRKITEIGKEGADVPLPKRGTDEYRIGHGKGGLTRRIFPGNKEYSAGDRIKRPEGGGGGSGNGQASPDGGGEGPTIRISREEFLEYYFADLGLPNMIKKGAMSSHQTQLKRSGISSSGSDDRRNLPFSARQRLKRKIPSESPYNKEIIKLLQEKREILSAHDSGAGAGISAVEDDFVPLVVEIENLEAQIATLYPRVESLLSEQEIIRIRDIDGQIEDVRRKKAAIPGWDPSVDIRYNNFSHVPIPISKAVVLCLMDVSGSMDEEKVYNSKSFFVLLQMFLDRHYDEVELVFIRHHTEAEEVDEDRFYNDKESGGTVVSTALDLTAEILEGERYPEAEWNIYVAQASDGDNYYSDNHKCADIMTNRILPRVQGFFYTEITRDPPQQLWQTYQSIREKFKDRFWTGRIMEKTDIWPVFREFFQRREDIAPKLQASRGPT